MKKFLLSCIIASIIGVTSSQAQLTIDVTNVDSVLCFGGSDGSISVIASGGTPPYTYLWNTVPVQTTTIVTGLPSGTYTVTVSDNAGSTTTKDIIIYEPAEMVVTTADNFDSLQCIGMTNGYVTINVVGGTFPWSFEWNTIPPQYTMTAQNLPAGNYTCTVTDANGCTATNDFTIVQPPLLSVQVDSLNEECFNSCDAQATAAVTGGVPPYTYSWSNGGTGLTLIGLCPGIYSLNVTDANGCVAVDDALVGTGTIVSASFSASAVNGNVPLDVDFTYTGTVSATSVYYWDFGDGTTSTLQNPPAHQFLYADTFDVQLFVMDGSCTDTFHVQINAGSTACYAQFGLYPDTVTEHHYYIVNMSTGVQPMSYLWNWGDGTTDTTQYPSHTYTDAGLYEICLSINDNSSCSSNYCDDSYIYKTTNTILSVNVIPQNGAGIIESGNGNATVIFPNPANNSISILNPGIDDSRMISVINVHGQLLLKQSVYHPKTVIDISHLSGGLYFLTIENKEGRHVQKLIKE